MFVGRKYELEALEKLYDSDKFEMFILYGRRRVGKTALINEFIKDKNHIFYVASQESKQDALKRFSEIVLDCFPMAKSMIDFFETWDKAFSYIGEQVGQDKLVVAIDEYPYLAESYSPISSILQNIIDHKWNKTRIKLIISGSSMSFMERQVLGYESPLYGRRTSQLKLLPFDYKESQEFIPCFSDEEKIISYGVVGGIPQYLLLLSQYSNITEGIKELYLKKYGHFYEETTSLLKQELREPAIYNSIIASIASGASTLNQIGTKTGIDNAKCAKYLRTLIDLHIVEKIAPINSKGKKNQIYSIKDLMFRFWYRYIPANITNIELGLSDYVLKNKILPDLSNFMGLAFENISKEYLLIENREMKLPFVFDNIGKWWGNNKILKKQEEIDIVCISGNKGLFAECKWRNEKLDYNIYEDLKRKSYLLLEFPERYYILFSKSGFTDRLLDEEKNDPKLMLVGMSDFFQS
ncbi:MAG: ATP-binding protein [Bacillota bacterium]|nr:ATP-binding protein [Bacillota bacterium]